MRPRSLDIEGLHSFKENVSIDFDKLGYTGIFGIFGPTGSGKSTILDAITLALYGEVTRADYGTHGIINVACQKSRVTFRFDILKKNKRETYLIERIFARRKGYENYATAKSARLIRIEQDDSIPIYDKPRDVTNGVIELLGLTHADFTRAVVLPQNKFQEFLLLDKLKKREMLERIFYLQEYGKTLIEKIAKKKTEVESACMETRAKLDVLDEASDEGVKLKKKEYEDAKVLREKTQKDLDKHDVLYKDAKQKWELTYEKSLIEGKIKEHEGKKDEFEVIRNKFLKANEALKIKDVVLKFKQDENILSNLNISLKESIDKLNKLNSEKDILQKKLQEFDKTIESRNPILIERKTNLQAVLSTRIEVEQLEKKREEKLETYKKLSNRADLLEKSIKFNSEKIQLLEERNKKFIEKAKELKVDDAYKTKVFEWISKEDSLLRAKKKLESDGKVCETYCKRIAEIEKKREELLQRIKMLKEEESSILKEVESLDERIEEDKASSLAKRLKHGEKCPVCGSLDHPEPFLIDPLRGEADLYQENNKNKLQKLKRDLEEKQRCISQNSLSLSKLEGELSTNNSNLEEGNNNLKMSEKEYTQDECKYNAFLKEYKINKVRDEYEKILNKEKTLEALRNDMEKEQDEIKKHQNELKKFQEEKGSLLSQISSIQTEGKALREQIDGLNEKILKVTDKSNIKEQIDDVQKEIDDGLKKQKSMQQSYNKMQEQIYKESDNKSILLTKEQILSKSVLEQEERIKIQVQEKGFKNLEDIEAYLVSKEEIDSLELKIKEYETEGLALKTQLETLSKKLGDKTLDKNEWEDIKQKLQDLTDKRDEAFSNFGIKKSEYETLNKKNEQWRKESGKFENLFKKKDLVEQLQKIFRGNNFIDFIAEERLKYIAKEASDMLGYLTRYRYALEINTENQFVVRDNFNGGSHRLVTSLSGGETFLTALSLALALSKHIQLKGQSPLEFFFLDEGFGTLDSSLLDVIMDSLERLSSKDRVIGLITHVPELKSRISKRILVTPPNDIDFVGSKVIVE